MVKPKYSNGVEVKVGDLVLDQDCDLCRVDQVWEGVNESSSDDILLCDIKLGTPFSYRALDIEYIVTKVS